MNNYIKCRQCATVQRAGSHGQCVECGSRYVAAACGGIDPEALDAMRSRARAGDTWHAYRNEDMGHRDLGRLTFLVVGPTRTFQVPPEHAPDSADIGLGWRYRHLGTVALDSGTVVADPADGGAQ